MFTIFARKFTTAIPKITLKDLGTNPNLNFVVTNDFFRIDIGLMICRRPIFYDMDEIEFEKMKQEHKLKMKYDLYPHLTKELMEFDRDDIEKIPNTMDEEITHFRRNSDGTKTYFRPNSKYYEYVNPNIFDHKHIHTHAMYNVYLLVKSNGQWIFPTTVGKMDQAFIHPFIHCLSNLLNLKTAKNSLFKM